MAKDQKIEQMLFNINMHPFLENPTARTVSYPTKMMFNEHFGT